MKVILVRHGESEMNVFNRDKYIMCTGQTDCDLSEEGYKQAEKLKSEPTLMDADAYFSSDLKRAVSTLRAFYDGESIIDKRLRERTLGDFDGVYVSEILANPENLKHFEDGHYKDDFIRKAPNGENYNDVCARMRSFIDDVKGKYGKIVIVSHLCAIRCFLHEAGALTEEETLEFHVGNCGIVETEI